MPFRVALISTGGTIEKTFDELHGVLQNGISVLDAILASLVLEGVVIDRIPLMNKDSLEMTEDDHERIAAAALGAAATHDGVVVVHGTDRLAVTGERIHARLHAPGAPKRPVIRPPIISQSDAMLSSGSLTVSLRAMPSSLISVRSLASGFSLRKPVR